MKHNKACDVITDHASGTLLYLFNSNNHNKLLNYRPGFRFYEYKAQTRAYFNPISANWRKSRNADSVMLSFMLVNILDRPSEVILRSVSWCHVYLIIWLITVHKLSELFTSHQTTFLLQRMLTELWLGQKLRISGARDAYTWGPKWRIPKAEWCMCELNITITL